WNNGASTNAGAITFGNGTTGISGVVSAANSLVGSTSGDYVGGNYGYGSVMVLPNGNYVVSSPNWHNGAGLQAGAVTFGNGTTVIAAIGPAGTSRGGSADDRVGSANVTVLANGNYVVSSPSWSNGAAGNAGAVTFGNGTTGISGVVSAANSLVGS